MSTTEDRAVFWVDSMNSTGRNTPIIISLPSIPELIYLQYRTRIKINPSPRFHELAMIGVNIKI